MFYVIVDVKYLDFIIKQYPWKRILFYAEIKVCNISYSIKQSVKGYDLTNKMFLCIELQGQMSHVKQKSSLG